MFDYAILQIVFALLFMSIPVGFATAIGWCDPTLHRKRPVLLVVSALFSGFGIFGLIKLVGICKEYLEPGQKFLDSATGLFNAIYEITVGSEAVREAKDQIHALVFSGVGIVFMVTAFILAIVFCYVLVFRIALRVDKKLLNSARYGVLAACLIVAVLLGVISSQYLIMGLAIAYIIASAAFLAYGNWRLMRYGNNDDADDADDEPDYVVAATDKDGGKAGKFQIDENDMAEEAKEFFGNTDSFKI